MDTQRRSGFTLIELLVVIAIIAILAAILFPVFAKAREKAREIASLSNEKQIGLATMQYTEDYDECYPFGNTLWSASWGSDRDNWAGAIAPYLKSTGVMASPDDTGAGQLTAGIQWEGLAESYAANGLETYWTPNGKNLCVGVMCGNWINNGLGEPVNLSRVVSPSTTIAYAEVYNSQLRAAAKAWPGQGFDDGNHANWWAQMITGWPYYINLTVPNQCGSTDNTAPEQCGAYPFGIDGAVSVHPDGMSNFVFADGHAKVMNPVATCPNNTVSTNWWNNGEYQSNSMWNAQNTL